MTLTLHASDVAGEAAGRLKVVRSLLANSDSDESGGWAENVALDQLNDVIELLEALKARQQSPAEGAR
jgi:hypothetical protein